METSVLNNKFVPIKSVNQNTKNTSVISGKDNLINHLLGKTCMDPKTGDIYIFYLAPNGEPEFVTFNVSYFDNK